MMLAGYGIGLPIVLFSAWNLWQHQWEPMWLFRVGMLPNYVASILIALGHIGLVMIVILIVFVTYNDVARWIDRITP